MPATNTVPPPAAPQYPNWLLVVIALLPSIISVLLTVVLILGADLRFVSLTDPETLNSLALIVVFILAGLAVGYGVRYLLPREKSQEGDEGTDRDRARIARWVVVAGTIGIFVTAIALIIVLRGDADRAYSVFTAILPVFSTWVGTVLAFYFSNESFQQAAKTSQLLLGGTGPTGSNDPVTRPGIMVPFNTIPRIEMNAEQMRGKQPRGAAGALNLKAVVDAFPQGAGRLIIFDDKKLPVYVLRRNALPTDVSPDATLSSYLSIGTNDETARNFTWTSATSSVAEARRLVELRRLSDLFITEQGGSSEPTLGWVPDENLART